MNGGIIMGVSSREWKRKGVRQRIQKETAKIKDCMWGSMKSLIQEKLSKIYKHMKTI